jgi:hypothetical protein
VKRYEGRRTADGAVVTVNGKTLDPRFDLRNHSPDGFHWGYGGSGPAQLALAIAADYFGDEVGESIYQDLKWALIAPIQSDKWTLASQEIRAWHAKAFPTTPEA